MGKRVVIATNNQGKVREFARMLGALGWGFVALGELGDFPDPVEDADTFDGNARIKALAAFEATGLPSLADDSGLAVDALGGAPGVFSKRFVSEDATEEENNARILELMAGVPEDMRSARYICSLVFVDADGSETMVHGACEGSIAQEERGANGFAYDTLFVADGCGGRTVAELDDEEKDRISHRGRALREFVRTVRER